MGKVKDKGSYKFDTKKFQQKLLLLVNERDSIYGLTTDFFNHKESAHQIVQFWSNAFENGNVEFRLALVYLANEILHNCKRKDASVYKDEFKKVLPNALSQLKGTNIVDKVVRVLELWSDRKLIDSAVCSGLIAGISSSAGSIEDAKIDPELIKNFSPDTVISALKEFLILETDTASKERQLGCMLSTEAHSAAAVRQLKDRSHGEAYRQQLDESCQRLEDLVRDLERLEERREALLSLLEKAHMFFAAQYSDVNVVVTAYRKYGEMVAFMRRRVEERLADSPDAETAADAPSPRADNADAFGVEVAVLSRREDEMELDSGGNSPAGGGPEAVQQHKRRHRKHRRHSGGGGSGSSGGPRRESSGGAGKSSNRKRSSRSSRSRSHSACSSDRSASNRPSQHQHHQRHELAIGSDSQPVRPAQHQHHTKQQHQHKPQHHHQQPGRSATPTLDERVSAVSSATTSVAAASPPAAAAVSSLPNPMTIGSWMPQQAWRPTLSVSSAAPAGAPTSAALRPPPLPPPPPFFPAFAAAGAPQLHQQQQHSAMLPSVMPNFGGGDTADRRRLQQQQFLPPAQAMFSPYRHGGPQQQQQHLPHQQQIPRPMFDGANRWRPVDGGFSQ